MDIKQFKNQFFGFKFRANIRELGYKIEDIKGGFSYPLHLIRMLLFYVLRIFRFAIWIVNIAITYYITVLIFGNDINSLAVEKLYMLVPISLIYTIIYNLVRPHE